MKAVDGKFVVTGTGEYLEVRLYPERKRNAGGRWMRIYKSTAARLAVDPRLHGQTFKVLLHLISVADSSNHIPGPTVVANSMKLRQPVISRAYSDLKNADVLYKKDGQYKLSPYVCWQGNQEQWNDAVRELTPGYKLTAITESTGKAG